MIQTVLGIETSCDETGIAIYHGIQGLLAHRLYSQISTHQRYGGVVPELAARDHIRKVLPLIEACLQDAGINKHALDGIAYTQGPGLIGALLVGAAIGRSLGWAWQIPTLGIHHMEGHLLAPMLDDPKPTFPFVALLVSGGHTQLLAVAGVGDYTLLGESLDDAAGEAFDKTAKLLGLPYPGGPHVAALALQGDESRFTFPRPMLDKPNSLDFSFSGLKTSVLHAWQKSQQTTQDKADIAAAFQRAVVDTLVEKCQRALRHTGYTQCVIAGGVSANALLRQALTQRLAPHKIELFYPRLEFCTDNGAMIAYAGYIRLRAGLSDSEGFSARARWSLTELEAIC